jgi:predicted XRE-type DNA-binding protein
MNTDYFISSGNVFKDLGLPNPDERLAKAKLAWKINRILASKGLTQREAAEFLDISRSKMSDLKNGRLGRFTPDLLFSLLGKLDHQVEIRVNPKSGYEKAETINVAVI